MAGPRKWLLVVAGVLLWLVAVLPAYYVVHKPLSSAQARALGSLMADVGLLLLTSAVAAGWGSRIARRVGVRFESGLEKWSLCSTLGLGLLGTLVFGLGVVGGFRRVIAYAVLIALLASARTEIRALARWLKSGLRDRRAVAASWLLIYSAAIGLLSFGAALLPPSSWDALVYHLQGPRLYVEAHRLIGVPDNFYLNWPAQVEMLFTWALLLKGDTLAQLLHWVFWPLTGALLYGLARRTIDERAGQWAVALWASVPLVSSVAAWAYVDVALTAFVFAAFYAFLRWADSQAEPWLLLAGGFAGLAITIKYTAVTWLAALILLVAYHAWRHHRRRLNWISARVLTLLAVAGLLAAPWLLKNWAVTGNPIYPLLFGGVGWNVTREAWLTLGGYGYRGGFLDYVTLPWLITVTGTGDTAAFDGTIGPLLLCLVPLVLLVRGRPRAVNYGLALAAVHWGCFLGGLFLYVFMAQTRLLIPVMPLLCLAAALGMRCLPRWDRPALRLSWVVTSIVALVLALNLLSEFYAFAADRLAGVLLGLESRDDYLTRRLGAYIEAVRYSERHLPGSARLLYLWEPRGYYGPASAQADPTLDNLAQLRLASGSAGEALQNLQARGFTHLLLYRAGLEMLSSTTASPPTLGSLIGRPPPGQSFYPITDADRRFLQDLLARCDLVERFGDSYEIHRLPRGRE